jgi:hypothetical protein
MHNKIIDFDRRFSHPIVFFYAQKNVIVIDLDRGCPFQIVFLHKKIVDFDGDFHGFPIVGLVRKKNRDFDTWITHCFC